MAAAGNSELIHPGGRLRLPTQGPLGVACVRCTFSVLQEGLSGMSDLTGPTRLLPQCLIFPSALFLDTRHGHCVTAPHLASPVIARLKFTCALDVEGGDGLALKAVSAFSLTKGESRLL